LGPIKMFAVIKTGGKQYRVAAADLIEVEKLTGAAGDQVSFGEVLMIGGEDATPAVGSPRVADASVSAEIVEQRRGPKVIAFKKRRRHNSKRKRGHRQELTLVRITEILAAGAQPAKRAKAAETAEAAGEAAPAPKRRRTKAAAKAEEKE
jgi:large subunit ribosomal protein L21